MAACNRFNAISPVQRDSEVRLQVSGDLADSETVARVESGAGSSQFNEQALSSGQALFTARGKFYVVTFFTKFLGKTKKTVDLEVAFLAGAPPNHRCTVSGKKGDPTSMVIFDLEVQ